MPAVRGAVGLSRAVRDGRLLGAAISWWPAQLEIFDLIEAHRSTVLAIGRQSGKSSIAAAVAVWDATCRPALDAAMAPGRVRYALVACPGQEQGRELVELAEAIVDASPALRRLVSVRADRLDFRIPRRRPDGGEFEARTAIRALPANSRTVRGVSASALIYDEYAHFGDSGGPGSDDRMWTALQPAARVFGAQSKVVVCSTPSGTSGRFFQLFESAEAGLLPSGCAVRAATAEVVPDIDPEWLDGQRVELGQALYEQEYEARFVSGAGSFFDDLDALEFEAGPVPPGDPRMDWVAALDPAFFGDRFGVVLLGQSRLAGDEIVVGSVAALEPAGNARSFDQRRAREDATLAAVWGLIAPYAPSRVVTDQHQSAAIESYFGRRGVRVETTHLSGPTQTAAFVALRSRLADGSLRLWRDPALIEDLRRVRARDSETIFLPRYGNSHCDLASALALGVSALTGRSAGRAVALPSITARLDGWDSSPLDSPGWLGGLDRW
jgi:hypothetical protein